MLLEPGSTSALLAGDEPQGKLVSDFSTGEEAAVPENMGEANPFSECYSI